MSPFITSLPVRSPAHLTLDPTDVGWPGAVTNDAQFVAGSSDGATRP